MPRATSLTDRLIDAPTARETRWATARIDTTTHARHRLHLAAAIATGLGDG